MEPHLQNKILVIFQHNRQARLSCFIKERLPQRDYCIQQGAGDDISDYLVSKHSRSRVGGGANLSLGVFLSSLV